MNILQSILAISSDAFDHLVDYLHDNWFFAFPALVAVAYIAVHVIARVPA